MVDFLEQRLGLETQPLLRLQLAALGHVADESAVTPLVAAGHGPHDQLALELRPVGAMKGEFPGPGRPLEFARHVVEQARRVPVLAAQREQLVDGPPHRTLERDVKFLGRVLIPLGHPAIRRDFDERLGRRVDNEPEAVLLAGQRLPRRGTLGVEAHGVNESGARCRHGLEFAHKLLIVAAGPIGHPDHADELGAVAEGQTEK